MLPTPAARLALRSLRPSTALTSFPQCATARTFYSFTTPTTTPRIVLDDGSTLIHRRQPTTASSGTPSEASLPPRLRTYPKRAILTPAQIAEVKSLRESDPDTWTVVQLARRFNTFPAFVMRVAPCPVERKKMVRESEERRFESLSIGKKKTAIDRLRRKDLW
ncbi:hypothetical protein HKX48_000668 [Thoreauomyces humboldtii]|nr:hypothetical protein HKX48_000668 [Thoreauomyces humboldtii]